MKKTKKIGLFIAETIICYIVIWGMRKTEIFIIPDSTEMVDFQFGIITVSTVFAGFSFTVLGMLLGMFSETVSKKLQNTSIVTNKSKKLKKSITHFCVSGLLSLVFILGIDQSIILIPRYGSYIVECLFLLCIFCLISGIIYFINSTMGVFYLISQLYGYDKKIYDEKRKNYEDTVRKAKEQSE